MAADSKTDFLLRVAATGSPGSGRAVLMTYDSYLRDNLRIAAEALQIGLIRLVSDADGLGHQIRITPAGRLLAHGKITEAAAVIDAGRTPIRITGPEPDGPIGVRLPPGSDPIPLSSGIVRGNAPEVLRGIATGHLMVEGDHLRPAASGRAIVGLRGGSPGTLTLGQRNLAGARRGGRG